MIVFVHGVPETGALWDRLRRLIDRDAVALDLPGFADPRPAGFGATKDDYVDWLLGELDGIEGPIDLVGHDWGAILTYRVATAYGDRLRSWAADCGNLVHPDYVWHDFAKVWQTPGDGEAFFEAQDALAPEERVAGYELLGLSREDALDMTTRADPSMAACILDLYRSATPNPHHHWGPLAPTFAPGLVLHMTDDPFGDEALGRASADALGAHFERVEGSGHFWPYQIPEAAAVVLEAFWDSVP